MDAHAPHILLPGFRVQGLGLASPMALPAQWPCQPFPAAVFTSSCILTQQCVCVRVCVRVCGVQLRSIQEQAHASMADVTAERDGAVKRNADLRRRHAHFQHEIRRKEQDYERLQVRKCCARREASCSSTAHGWAC